MQAAFMPGQKNCAQRPHVAHVAARLCALIALWILAKAGRRNCASNGNLSRACNVF